MRGCFMVFILSFLFSLLMVSSVHSMETEKFIEAKQLYKELVEYLDKEKITDPLMRAILLNDIKRATGYSVEDTGNDSPKDTHIDTSITADCEHEHDHFGFVGGYDPIAAHVPSIDQEYHDHGGSIYLH